MQIKRSLWKPAIIGLIAVVSGGWLLQQGAEGNVYLKMRMFQDIVRTVSDRYVDPVEPSELYDLAIDGLLEQLGDPHSTLLRPEDYSQLRLQTTGNYGGLGIRIDQKDDWITVVQTLPNTPADRAGLKPGDRLIEVNGESMEGWRADDAVRVLRGPKGSPVDLTVLRIGVREPIPVRIVRDEIHVEYVTGFMYEPGIGYISHRQFSERSADDIRRTIEDLVNEGMEGLILDLRANPGGLLEEGVAVSDLFLDSGSEVVATRSRIPEQNDIYYAERAPLSPALPVVVLVDGFSASASEIVAGALQDHDRALVVGTSTFGKGSVQTLFPLPGGNYLKLTTAKWYTPSGRSIQRETGHGTVALQTQSGPAAVDEESASASALSAPVQEIYYTDSGREVFGGGGITPDLLAQPDTLTTVEQDFRRALGDQVSTYSDAMFRFAVQYNNEHAQLTPDFRVTSAMLDELFTWLIEADVDVSRSLFDGSRRLIERELGIQLATIAFDETSSMRRRLVLDSQVATAADLLRQSRDQQQLFAQAELRRKDETAIREQ